LDCFAESSLAKRFYLLNPTIRVDKLKIHAHKLKAAKVVEQALDPTFMA